MHEFYFCAILPKLSLPRNPEIREPKESLSLQDKEAQLHHIRKVTHTTILSYRFLCHVHMLSL